MQLYNTDKIIKCHSSDSCSGSLQSSSIFAQPDINTRGLGEFETVMQTRDEVEGLHNCREFSQPLECLYQAMQIQEKVFYCFYKLTSLRKKTKLFVIALIKKEILTIREVLYMKPCMCNQFLFCKKVTFQNTDFLRLKCQLLKVKVIDITYLERFSNFQWTRQWVNKVNLQSCQLKNYFKLVLV